jgi:N-acetylglucosaminyl-diphospho-decaprenol L-rhamnosyltransferase
VELSYCVVNTNGGPLLARCLDAIERTAPADVVYEVLVLDNASDDGSADAARGRAGVRLIELERRTGKAANDSTLLQAASGRFCLLLNEDAELCDGAVDALLDALRHDPRAAAAGAQLLAPDGTPQPCAWRLPSVATALAGAVFLHRVATVQSGGDSVREVGWMQSSALLVRRDAAAQVGWLDPEFFVYSDETDFQKRLHDAGWRVLYVPQARAVHHEQLSTDAAAAGRRITEFHRGRDRYMRKHHGPAAAAAVRVLTAWAYGLRALAAVAIPGRDPSRMALHAWRALLPSRGEGLREAAERFNEGDSVPDPGGKRGLSPISKRLRS